MRTTALLAALFLAAPAPLAAAGADVPPEAVVGTLPFLEVDEPNRIYVDLAPAGASPFRLLLDTGATHAVMTPLAARAAGVSVRALKSAPYRRKTQLGRDLQFYVDTDVSDTGSQGGWEFGVLGGDFLKQFVVELDFAARAVRFIDPRRYSLLEVEPGPDHELVVLRDSPRPILPISLGGRELAVIADTGAPWPLVLSGKAAKAAGIDVASLPPFGKIGFVRGEVEVRLYHAADLAIGGFHFADVPVVIAPNGAFNLGGEAGDSLLGYDLLSRFLVRIDYAGRRMWLRRTSEQVVFNGVDYALTRATGAYLEPWQAGARVLAVTPDSPAAKRGLREGDFLTRESPEATPEASLRAIADGKPLQVKRQEGDRMIDVALEPNGPDAPP
jgi:predicted aspartyl protease